MHASLVLGTAAVARRSARRRAVPRAVRRRARRATLRGGDAPHRHDAADHAALRPREDALRAADVGIVASGTATLEAALARCPHVVFYRVSSIDRVAWSGASSCCPMSGCPTCSPDASSCPNSCRTQATPRNLAQAALNLFDDTVTRQRLEALFAGFARRARADTGALAARGGRSRSSRERRGSRAARRHRRGRARTARRSGLRRGRDPRSRRGHPRTARFEGAAARAARGARGRRSARGPSRGRSRPPTCRDRHAQHPAGDAARDAARGRGARRCRRRRRSSTATVPDARCAPCTRSSRATATSRRSRRRRSSPRPRATRCCVELDAHVSELRLRAATRATATPEHLAALDRYGPCPIHRRSFAPVVQISFGF